MVHEKIKITIRGGAIRTSEARIDYSGPIVTGEVDTANDVGSIAISTVTEYFHRHDLYMRSDTCYTGSIVHDSTDGSSYMRSMSVVIERITIVICKIITMLTISERGSSIREAIPSIPHIDGKIGMQIVDARIEYCDDRSGS